MGLKLCRPHHSMLLESSPHSTGSLPKPVWDGEPCWLASIDVWCFDVPENSMQTKRSWRKEQHHIPMRLDIDNTTGYMLFPGEVHLVCDRFVCGTGSNVLRLPASWERIVVKVLVTDQSHYQKTDCENAKQIAFTSVTKSHDVFRNEKSTKKVLTQNRHRDSDDMSELSKDVKVVLKRRTGCETGLSTSSAPDLKDKAWYMCNIIARVEGVRAGLSSPELRAYDASVAQMQNAKQYSPQTQSSETSPPRPQRERASPSGSPQIKHIRYHV
eukprot:TRINITY_DN6267_c0_g1_i2.p1 TRINITY_DN6267_c0_g1~~TRINITY_DN6267_c0_g1_i2.p1  ORF type:complete len:270 (-),score=12.14 TRINITY_DN6267_c0_g1_i2:2-811(-)